MRSPSLRLARRGTMLLTLMALAGCDEPLLVPGVLADTVHIRGEVPPLIAYESGDVVLGRIAYIPCRPPDGGWLMNWLPEEDPMVLDLQYSGGPPGGLSPRAREDIEHAGAEILRVGNLGIVRVRVRRRSVIWLTPDVARVVPREDRMDTRVSVGIEEPAVRDVYEALGGEIERELLFDVRVIQGAMPNAAVPSLEEHPGVIWVEADGLLCPL